MEPSFVYDRTQADVDRVKVLAKKGFSGMTEAEQTEWLAGMKGALNLSDLSRIVNAMVYIAGWLGVSISTKSVPSMPKAAFYKSMLSDIAKLRSTTLVHADTPVTPVRPVNTYQKVNDIEHILHDIYSIIADPNQYCYYSGNEISAGDSIGALL